MCLIPVGPATADPRPVENHLQAGPLLQPRLLLLVNAPLHDLQPGPDADVPQLRDDALAARIVCRCRGEPIDVEAVGIACLAHQLFGPSQVALKLRPVDGILHVVVDPIAVDLPSPPASASFMACRSMAKLTASRTRLSWKGVLGILKVGKLQPPGTESTGASIIWRSPSPGQ